MLDRKITFMFLIVFCLVLILTGCGRKAKEKATSAAKAAEVARAEAEVAKKKMLEAKAEAQVAEKKADIASQLAKTTESTLNVVKGTLESTEQELEKVAAILVKTEKDKSSLEIEIDGIKETLEQSRTKAEASEQARADLAKKVDELQKQVNDLTKQYEDALAEVKKFKQTNAELNTQAETHKEEMDQKKSQAKELEEILTASEVSDGAAESVLQSNPVEEKSVPVALASEGQTELGITVDATWVSKYIFRGIDKLDDKAAFQPSINLDLYGSGLSFKVWSSFAGASKNNGSVSTVDREEWDYSLTYGSSYDSAQFGKTNYAVSWVYYDYPDVASNDADTQEFNASLSWPELCPMGFVPSYTIVYSWPSEGKGAVRKTEGFIHVFGLGYDMDCPELGQTLSFSGAAVYNDGTYGSTIDHDWSHIQWGVSTSFACPNGGTITPALYYQTSMEDTVNTEDELWVGVSYGYSF